MQHLDGPDGRHELLALRTLKLGDLLVAVPAISALRRGFPQHRLVLAVPGWLEPIVELIDGVDALLPTPGLNAPLDLEPGRIDVAVNLHGSGPESRDIVDRLAARLTIAHAVPEIDGVIPADSRMPEWMPELLERYRWVRLLRAYGIPGDPNEVRLGSSTRRPGPADASVVHVGAFYGSRRWPVERFAAVARIMRASGHRVVFTGSAAERDRALAVAEAAGFHERAVLAGRLDLAEFAAVIEDARVVVSADTGAAHLASAYGRPSVVLFGPAAPENWGPPPGPHLVLTDASLRRGDTFSNEADPALMAVGVNDVVAGVEAMLATARG